MTIFPSPAFYDCPTKRGGGGGGGCVKEVPFRSRRVTVLMGYGVLLIGGGVFRDTLTTQPCN